MPTANVVGRIASRGSASAAPIKSIQAVLTAPHRTLAVFAYIRSGAPRGRTASRGVIRAYRYNWAVGRTPARGVVQAFHAANLQAPQDSSRPRATAGGGHSGSGNVRGRVSSRGVVVALRAGAPRGRIALRGFCTSSGGGRVASSGGRVPFTRSDLSSTAQHPLRGVVKFGRLSGVLVADVDSVFSYETETNPNGSRETVGVLVYAIDVLTLADVADVPYGRDFLVSGAYAGGPLDPIRAAGGDPFDIGQRLRVGAADTFVFRSPVPGEVVCYVPARALYRYEQDPETGESRWAPYRSMPQRFLEGNTAIAMMDPDGLLDFYGMLLGTLQSTLTTETANLREQTDADAALPEYLPEAASLFGLKLPGLTAEGSRRRVLRTAVPSMRVAGTEVSIKARLLSLGYAAFVHDVWVNPGVPAIALVSTVYGGAANLELTYTPTTTVNTETTTIPLILGGFSGGSAVTYARAHIVFADEVQPRDGDLLTVRTPTLTKVFEFNSSGGVGGGNTAVAVGASAAVTATNLRNALAAAGLTLTATVITPVSSRPYATSAPGVSYSDFALGVGGTAPPADSVWTGESLSAHADFVSVAKGNTPQGPYFPSSRIAVYLMGASGQSLGDVGDETRAALADALDQILPLPVDVRLIGSAFPMSDGIAVTETLAITHV